METNIPSSTIKANPFNFPELRKRISRYVSLTDAVACVRVSKDWSYTFVPVVWFEVDFSIHPRFADLSPDIVTKHGQYIRIVKNARTIPQVRALSNASVAKLRWLHIEAAASVMQNIRAYEIISRSIPSLEYIRLFATTESINGEYSLTHFVSTTSLSPYSAGLLGTTTNLTVLRIERLYLTHEGLLILLQANPMLIELIFVRTVLVGNISQSFRHPGIMKLAASVEWLFHGNPADPPLLSYLPNLKCLDTWQERLDTPIHTEKIKEDVARFCPLLTKYGLQGSRDLLHPFCTHIGRNITSVTFEFSHFPGDTIMALLLHKTTLKRVALYSERSGVSFNVDEVEPVSEGLQDISQFFQLIPRCCSRLKELDLHLHQMDMDEIEMGEWACKDLKILRIRVKGLDTKGKILEAIELWRKGCRRRRQEEAGLVAAIEKKQDHKDLLLEERVARHLLKLENLKYVWLGYQTWAPI
jgi:hypothetical protein